MEFDMTRPRKPPMSDLLADARTRKEQEVRITHKGTTATYHVRFYTPDYNPLANEMVDAIKLSLRIGANALPRGRPLRLVCIVPEQACLPERERPTWDGVWLVPGGEKRAPRWRDAVRVEIHGLKSCANSVRYPCRDPLCTAVHSARKKR